MSFELSVSMKLANREDMQPRYETKQVISRVSEKIELEKWVMGLSLSYEIWVIRTKLCVMLKSKRPYF